MTERTTSWIRMIVMALAALLVAAPALGGTITLRPSVTIDGARDITLADIAELEGAEAQALATMPMGSVENAREISIAQVREALDERRVNWGRVALRGGSCVVRVASPRVLRESTDAPDTPSPSSSGVETVRDRIVATLRELFGAAPESIRVTLDDSGKDLLTRAIQGRRVDIETSSASSSRLNIRVWMYEGDRLVADGTVRADVSLLVECFTLATPVGKGDRIDASMLTRTTMWMSPAGAPPIREEGRAVGAVARTRLDAGTVLRTDHVEAPIVIKRGDLVSVHALAGAMVLKTQARALADAREGEMVELSRGRDRKPFLARAAAPGIAVLETGSKREDRE